MNEISLIKSAQNGDKKAFSDLIRLYYPYVSKFLLKLCSDKNLSEDLTQDTFVKLIRSIEKFNIYREATFTTYIMTIAKNCYIDFLRKNKQIIVSIETQEIVSSVALQNSVIDGLELQEVIKAIDTLPQEQATAIKLKYLERLTLLEIAEKFNCEPKTIKSRIHNGKVKLRQILKRGEWHE